MKCMAITSEGLAELEARKAAFGALTDEQRETFVKARAAARAHKPTPVRPAPKPRAIAPAQPITKKETTMNQPAKINAAGIRLAQHGISIGEPPRGLSAADRERVARAFDRGGDRTGVRNDGPRLVLGVTAEEDDTSPTRTKGDKDLEKRVAELEKRVAQLEGKDEDDDEKPTTGSRRSSKLSAADRARIDRAFGLGGTSSEVYRDGARLVLGASKGVR